MFPSRVFFPQSFFVEDFSVSGLEKSFLNNIVSTYLLKAHSLKLSKSALNSYVYTKLFVQGWFVLQMLGCFFFLVFETGPLLQQHKKGIMKYSVAWYLIILTLVC